LNQLLDNPCFETSPLSCLAANAGEALPHNTGADGKVPPSSWLLCKWRRGGSKDKALTMWQSLNAPYQLNQVYSRSIRAYDTVLSKLDGAMYGFEPSDKYSVSFWYRPRVRKRTQTLYACLLSQAKIQQQFSLIFLDTFL